MECSGPPEFRFNFVAGAAPPHATEPQQNLEKNNCLFGYDDEGDAPLPQPREVFRSEVEALAPLSTDPVVFHGGFTLLKVRPGTSDITGVGKTDLVPGKYEGGLKLWECTVDLVNTMRREIKDGQLSFRGKRVLELGCGHGLPGIFAILKGATTVHFQDFNPEVLQSVTIPNVVTNLEQAQARSKLESGVISKSGQLSPQVHYYAGDWGNVYGLLSIVGSEDNSDASSEEDFSQASGIRLDDSNAIDGQPRPLRRKRSNSSRAFERALLDVPDGGYDIILMSETVYFLPSLPKLYNLIKKCLRPPYGVLYVAAKKHYFGVGGGARQFKAVVDEDGVLGAHLVTDFADGSSNMREIWKFFFR